MSCARPRLAVILAAGRGIRLGGLGQQIPKGFIPLGGTTLIERSLAALRGAGIERVLIVTGHLAERYEALAAATDGWIRTVCNPDFADSGSLASLVCAGVIDEPYLLVESDLLYDPRAPRLLCAAAEPDLLLASGATGSGDEVYVAAEGGRLRDLSKQLAALNGPRVGELVGLTRISPALHAEVARQAERLLAVTAKVEYETALVAAARIHPLPVLVVEDLIWTEIDDADHLRRAQERILPALDVSEA